MKKTLRTAPGSFQARVRPAPLGRGSAEAKRAERTVNVSAASTAVATASRRLRVVNVRMVVVILCGGKRFVNSGKGPDPPRPLPESTSSRDNDRVGVLRFFGSALAKFDRDRGFFLASGIAFQMLLCLVPFTLLVLSFAGAYLSAHQAVIDQIGRYLEQAAPALDPAVRKNLLEIIGHRTTTGVVGTIGLIWIASTVFGWLRIALNTIFEVPKARGTLRGMGLDLVMIVLCGTSFLFSVGLTAVIEYLRRVSSPLFPALTGRLLGIALSYLVPFLVMLMICFLIYHLVPNRRVSLRAALLGAVFTGLLWEAAKHLFTWYVTAFKSYSLLYGSLSAAVVLLAWTYYSAAVLLLGAEVTVLLERELTTRAPR